MDDNPLVPLRITAPACGLMGILAIWIARGLLRKQWAMDLPAAMLLFLGASLLPSAVMFLIFPFLDPKPDLAEHYPLLPIVGLGLLWACFAALKQGYDGKQSS